MKTSRSLTGRQFLISSKQTILGPPLRWMSEMDERIESHANQLAQFPESGRVGRVEKTRELVISGSPYLIIYLTVKGAVIVVRVLHGAQMWPE